MLGRPIAGTSVRLTLVAPADRDESSGASHEDDSADSIVHGGGDDDTASATDCEDDESEEASSEDQTSEEDASEDDESEEASIEEQPAKKKKKESANHTEPHHVHHTSTTPCTCIHSPPHLIHLCCISISMQALPRSGTYASRAHEAAKNPEANDMRRKQRTTKEVLKLLRKREGVSVEILNRIILGLTKREREKLREMGAMQQEHYIAKRSAVQFIVEQAFTALKVTATLRPTPPSQPSTHVHSDRNEDI